MKKVKLEKFWETLDMTSRQKKKKGDKRKEAATLRNTCN